MAIDFSEYGLFKRSNGTQVTYEDLLADIYENADDDRKTIQVLVEQLSELISSPSDAVVLMEHITGLLDARVKNSDLLVKVASIVSRMILKNVTEAGSDDGGFIISEEEKKQLLDMGEAAHKREIMSVVPREKTE